MLFSLYLPVIASATLVIAQEPAHMPVLIRPKYTGRFNRNLARQVSESNGAVEPSPTISTPSNSTSSTSTVTEPHSTCRTWFSGQVGCVGTLGWTAKVDAAKSAPTTFWESKTHNPWHTGFCSADRFFVELYKGSDLTWGPEDITCTPRFTACAAGWIEGTTTAFLCQTGSSRCVTNLYYTSYGASDPLSQIVCQRDPTPTVYYAVSPTVPAKIPDVPPLKPALPAREEKRTNTAHVIYPTVFGLIIVVLVTFIIRTDIKDSRVRRRKLTATITSTDVSPNLGVPLVRIQGAESNNVSRHDTDPPPYEPRQ